MFTSLCGLDAVDRRAQWIVGTHPRDPVLAEILGLQTPGPSGVNVNRVSVIGYPPVWRGVNLISRDVGKLPLFVYKRLTGGGKERAPEHPAYKLLRYRPNDQMTAFVFWQTMLGHAILDGNGYAFISRDGGGKPIELWPLLPDRTRPERVDGVLWYITRVRDAAGRTEERKIPAEDVLHFKGLSYNGLIGLSLIEVAAETFGLGLAAAKFGSTFFANGAHAEYVLLHPGKLSPEAMDNLRDSIKKMHGGLDKSHKGMIFEEGMTFQQLTIPPEEAQFLETRKFSAVEIANLLGLPPHKVGDEGRTSFASLEEENQSYLDESLDPWLVNIESECREKLLTEEEKENDSHVVEFLRQALMRADLKSRYESYAIGILNRIINPNEAREKENMNPYEGGDEFLVPLNMGSPADGDDVQPEPDDDGDDDRAMRASNCFIAHGTAAHQAAQRALRIVGSKVRRKANAAEDFSAWPLHNECRELVASIMLEPLVPWLTYAAPDAEPEEFAERAADVLLEEVHHKFMGDFASCPGEKLASAVDTITREWSPGIPDLVMKTLTRDILIERDKANGKSKT